MKWKGYQFSCVADASIQYQLIITELKYPLNHHKKRTEENLKEYNTVSICIVWQVETNYRCSHKWYCKGLSMTEAKGSENFWVS